jgi:hypothetical protein
MQNGDENRVKIRSDKSIVFSKKTKKKCECTLTQKHHKILRHETIYGKNEDHSKKGGAKSRRKEARAKKRPVPIEYQ